MMKSNLQHENKPSVLRVHEWLAIAVVIGIVGGIASLTTFQGNKDVRNGCPQTQVEEDCGFDILVKGAVDHPGIYHIHSEMKMKDILALAGMHPNADLRRFNLEATVRKGRVINVPLRQMINVHLKGAVEGDQLIIVPKGSKVEDLLDTIKFSANADVKALKKKRRLKPDEVIYVPVLKNSREK